MKILVLSDSHGDFATMCDVVENEQPDMIIFLGDGIADADKISQEFPDIQMIKNLGNADPQKEGEECIKYAEICGKRFMMTHGHTFYSGINITQATMTEAREKIFELMSENNIDIMLHGHIHQPFAYCNYTLQPKHGWIICPGRVGRYSDSIRPTYGVLKIKDSGALEWKFVEVE